MTYSAEPICDEMHDPVALDLHIVTFQASYYKSQLGLSEGLITFKVTYARLVLGRKKIDQVENEIRRLTKLADYDHVQRVFTVQSNNAKSDQTPRLTILMEKKPSFTLLDLLQDRPKNRRPSELTSLCRSFGRRRSWC